MIEKIEILVEKAKKQSMVWRVEVVLLPLPLSLSLVESRV